MKKVKNNLFAGLKVVLATLIIASLSLTMISCDFLSSDNKDDIPSNSETHETDANGTPITPGQNGTDTQTKVVKPGLYATGTETLLKSWNVLLDEGLITVKETVITGSGELNGDLYLPNAATQIAKKAFANKTGLSAVHMGRDLVNIAESAFLGCTGLKNVTISNGVTNIGKSAFSGCTGLETLVIGENVTNIGASAFTGCTNLRYLIIPDRVSFIGASAFSGCTGLTNVYVGRSVTNIGDSAFNNCAGIESIFLPIRLSLIGAKTFANCNSISVKYEGGKTNFDRITIGKTNDPFLNATVTYNIRAKDEKASIQLLIDELNGVEKEAEKTQPQT